jgi:hypothetical protein
MKYLQLGDMLVAGEFSTRFIRALAVIAQHLHSGYDALENRGKAGSSKETCLFTSLVVRDLLVHAGFRDADVRPCLVCARAERDGRETWSVGIGVPGQTDLPDKFNGHAAVAVPSAGALVDATLYQIIRPQWNGAVTGMMAVPLGKEPWRKVLGAPQLAGLEMRDDTGLLFEIGWGNRPEIKWRRELDATEPNSMRRRRALAKVLCEAFGVFEGA